MHSKVATYAENICESGCACLVTMVQGNLLALTASHWLTASETGLLAGAVTSTAVIAAKIRRPWIVSVTLGVVTTVADFMIHPATFNVGGVTEAVVTGIGAAALSFGLAVAGRRLGRLAQSTMA